MGELVQKNVYNYIGLPIGRQNVKSKSKIRTGQEIYEAVCQMADLFQYEVEQRNGQRFFGPPKNALLTPSKECEIFVGSIPREVYEDVLIPVLKMVKGLHLFRLMMDFSGNNRGFGFALYSTPDQAKEAVRLLDKYEILPGRFLAVLTCNDNNTLYMGGLEHRSPQEIIAIILGKTPNALNVQVTYPDKKGKRYVIIRYANHREAALARRYYLVANYDLWWPKSQVIVDWTNRHFVKEPFMFLSSVIILNEYPDFKKDALNLLPVINAVGGTLVILASIMTYLREKNNYYSDLIFMPAYAIMNFAIAALTSSLELRIITIITGIFLSIDALLVYCIACSFGGSEISDF